MRTIIYNSNCGSAGTFLFFRSVERGVEPKSTRTGSDVSFPFPVLDLLFVIFYYVWVELLSSFEHKTKRSRFYANWLVDCERLRVVRSLFNISLSSFHSPFLFLCGILNSFSATQTYSNFNGTRSAVKSVALSICAAPLSRVSCLP